MTFDGDEPLERLPTPDARRHLRRLANAGPAVDPTRDAAIRVGIRTTIRRGAGPRMSWLRTAASIAAVVAVIIGGALWMRSHLDAHIVRSQAEVALVGAIRAADASATGTSDPRVQAILTAIVAMAAPTSTIDVPSDAPFLAIDIVADDGGDAVGAYTIDLALPGALVGIESGDGAFSEPATYDPQALSTGRVVLASVADGARSATDGPTRIATVMIRVVNPDDMPFVYDATLVRRDGTRSNAALRLVSRSPL